MRQFHIFTNCNTTSKKVTATQKDTKLQNKRQEINVSTAVKIRTVPTLKCCR